ncbi:hypothetical protein [Flavobacterium hercynium]|uniref:DUF304 domain-containing protein n=1 Tax=Flavobacterium hercynium TaxID=387094 RepID=A0A226GP61_9FLAO|nr:hypothetical protein [Flavobacterium hercynium]OXA83180.1 hypothetical protein B0A66_22500 [Flavobacterium hercynium]SMP37256.1 hypothetical protein SAMN06265346_1295 [Flavobacterium hercynium]
MKEFKKFTKAGNLYTLKRQFGFSIIVVALFLVFAYICFTSKMSMFGWGLIAVSAFCAIAFWLQHFSIDMDDKVMTAKMGLIKKTVYIPLTDIRNFRVVKISHNFIRTNVILNVSYVEDGKEKVTGITQAFTVRAIQNTINEIEEIIHSDDHSRKV